MFSKFKQNVNKSKMRKMNKKVKVMKIVLKFRIKIM